MKISIFITFIIFIMMISPTLVEAHQVPVPTNISIFEENKGQLPEHILYSAHIGSHMMYIEQGKIRWHLIEPQEDHNCEQHRKCFHHEAPRKHHFFDVRFNHSNIIKETAQESPSSFPKHFLKGKKENFATNVFDYGEISLKNLYDQIDLKYYTTNKGLKYDFIVHPGGDPNQIEMTYDGVDSIAIKENNLVVYTSVDSIIEVKPYAYQQAFDALHTVDVEFELKGNTVSFKLGDYNSNLPLIIDPDLLFSTYSGSRGDNWGYTATPGQNGEFYAGGIAFNTAYFASDDVQGGVFSNFNPNTGEVTISDDRGVVVGSFEETDVLIVKYTPDGSEVEYYTYLGGGGTESPHSIITNSRNELVVFGTSSSASFPGSPVRNEGGKDAIENGVPYGGGSDIFLAVISENGQNIVGSTLIGGSENDGLNGAFSFNQNNLSQIAQNYGDQYRGEVIVDQDDNIYVSSCTYSEDFPADNTKSANQDAVFFSYNRTCDNRRFSRFFGGDGEDAGFGIKIGDNGSIYAVGITNSTNLPGTSGSFSNAYNGGISDGFVTRLPENGSRIIRTAYVGTENLDNTLLIDIGPDGNIFITGQSEGQTLVSNNVYSNANSGQYIYKLLPDLSSVELGTAFGSGRGPVDISLTAFLVDDCGRIFISGWGGSTNSDFRRQRSLSIATSTNNMPIFDPIQSNTDGNDFYFMALERDFQEILFGSYFGRDENRELGSGDHVDGGTSRFDEEGVIYQAICAGCGGGNGFPTTPNAFSRTNNSTNCNMAALKIDFELSIIEAQYDVELDTIGCAPYEARFFNETEDADEVLWDFGFYGTSTEENPTVLFDSIGVYPVKLIAISNDVCIPNDTLDFNITILPTLPPSDTFILECNADNYFLTSKNPQPGAEYQWSNGASTQNLTVQESGIYWVRTTVGNCVFLDTFDVNLINPNVRLEDLSLCGEDSTVLRLDGRADQILWSTGDTSNSILVEENGVYSVDYNIDICEYNEEATVLFPTIPEVSIEGPDRGCQGDGVDLVAENQSGATISSFSWSSGETSPSISVQQSGTYIVTVMSDSNCVFSAEKDVFIVPIVPEQNIPDTQLCADGQLNVNLSLYDSIEADITWFDDGSQITRTFNETGKYSYTISSECQNFTDEFTLTYSPYVSDDQPFYVPNIFSPNNDNLNDVLKIEKARELRVNSFRLQIYDRWGNRVFETRNPEIGWDSIFKDISMTDAVFAYVLEMNYFLCEEPQDVKLSGDITISQ